MSKTEKKRILGVIPARFKSTRFEGKPLVEIKGVPMIKRTYLQARQSTLLEDVVVATEDHRIFDFCDSEEIPVMMTTDIALSWAASLSASAVALYSPSLKALSASGRFKINVRTRPSVFMSIPMFSLLCASSRSRSIPRPA